jgi:hypothetical protein
MPGGYAFRAKEIVRWTRERSSGADSPAGFGVRVTDIPEDGRRHVNRYVEHREPLFFDDL